MCQTLLLHSSVSAEERPPFDSMDSDAEADRRVAVGANNCVSQVSQQQQQQQVPCEKIPATEDQDESRVDEFHGAVVVAQWILEPVQRLIATLNSLAVFVLHRSPLFGLFRNNKASQAIKAKQQRVADTNTFVSSARLCPSIDCCQDANERGDKQQPVCGRISDRPNGRQMFQSLSTTTGTMSTATGGSSNKSADNDCEKGLTSIHDHNNEQNQNPVLAAASAPPATSSPAPVQPPAASARRQVETAASYKQQEEARELGTRNEHREAEKEQKQQQQQQQVFVDQLVNAVLSEAFSAIDKTTRRELANSSDKSQNQTATTTTTTTVGECCAGSKVNNQLQGDDSVGYRRGANACREVDDRSSVNNSLKVNNAAGNITMAHEIEVEAASKQKSDSNGSLSFSALSHLQPIIKRPSESELLEAKSRLTSRNRDDCQSKDKSQEQRTANGDRDDSNSDKNNNNNTASCQVRVVDETDWQSSSPEADIVPMNNASHNLNRSSTADVDELILRPVSALSLSSVSSDIDVETVSDADLHDTGNKSMEAETNDRGQVTPASSCVSPATNDDVAEGEIGAAEGKVIEGNNNPINITDDSRSCADSSASPVYDNYASYGDVGDAAIDGDEAAAAAASGDTDDHFCARPASDATLRRLRKSALDDVRVCDESRASTQAARRLFAAAGPERASSTQPRPPGESDIALTVNQQRRPKSAASHFRSEATQVRKSSSGGSSASGGAGSADDNNDCYSVSAESDYNSGTIKLARRTGSSASSSGQQHQFGRHLVCCVSPSPSHRLSGSGSVISSTATSPQDELPHGILPGTGAARRRDSSTGASDDKASGIVEPQYDDVYPLDDDEVRQCQAAFRENKRRLIECQQVEAAAAAAGTLTGTGSSAGGSVLAADDAAYLSSSDQTINQHRIRPQSAPLASEWYSNSDTNSKALEASGNGNGKGATATAAAAAGSTAGNLWRSRLSTRDLSNKEQSVCSNCKQRLYPMDKLELDFTRTKLNIHKNCFKCQVCSTLLRLETYAAIDAKLYCPAHIRHAPQLQQLNGRVRLGPDSMEPQQQASAPLRHLLAEP